MTIKREIPIVPNLPYQSRGERESRSTKLFTPALILCSTRSTKQHLTEQQAAWSCFPPLFIMASLYQVPEVTPTSTEAITPSHSSHDGHTAISESKSFR